MSAAIAMVCAFCVAFVVASLLVRPGAKLQILDYPNARSLHTKPVPRTGGLAIGAGIASGLAIAFVVVDKYADLALLIVAWLLVGAISFVDDLFRVPAVLRLVFHVLGATAVLTGGLEVSSLIVPGMELELPHGLAVSLGIIVIVWMINLYNFMDGIDGFAAGMAIIGFGVYALLGWFAGHYEFLLLNLTIAGAAMGFLLFNFPPARIFMGDVGSSTLGLFAGALTIWAARDDIFPFWIGVLVFSPFVVDATVTLIRRALRGDKIWIAHSAHYYQRLVTLGWGHKRTTLGGYVLMVLSGSSAIVVSTQGPLVQWSAILVWAGVYIAVILFIRMKERQAAQRALGGYGHGRNLG